MNSNSANKPAPARPLRISREIAARQAARTAPPTPPPRNLVRRALVITAAVGMLLIITDIILQARKIPRARPIDTATALVLGINDQRFVDAEKRFALTVPEGWIVRTGETVAPRAAVFRGPRYLEVWVSISDVPYDTPEKLKSDLYAIERHLSVNSHVTPVVFKGASAFERRYRLYASEVISLNFLIGHTAHHIEASAPGGQMASYEKLLRDILQTYEAGPLGGDAPSAGNADLLAPAAP